MDDKDLELQKLEFEREKLTMNERLERDKLSEIKQIEQEKLKVERYKAKLQVLAIGVPLLAAVFTVIITFVINTVQSNAQFRMKTAELIMKDGGPYEALGRAQMLAKIFPDSLQGINLDFNPGNYSKEPDDMKTKLFEIIAEHYEHRTDIVDIYEKLFPDDRWIDRLRIEPQEGANGGP